MGKINYEQMYKALEKRIIDESVRMSKVYESIFNGKTIVIPMADVHHIIKQENEILVILNETRWNFKHDFWENPISLVDGENKETGWKSTEATDFMKAWCNYRHEIEGGNESFSSPVD